MSLRRYNHIHVLESHPYDSSFLQDVLTMILNSMSVCHKSNLHIHIIYMYYNYHYQLYSAALQW